MQTLNLILVEKKLELYPKNGKFDFIISSIAKSCGHNNFKIIISVASINL
jgi:hypothetical protein